jgi:restriction endonuclease S subunit
LLNTKQFIDYTTQNAKGSAYPEISKKDLLNYTINIPTLFIQQKIIDIIEPNQKLFLQYNKCIRIDIYEHTKIDMKNLIDIIEPFEKMEKSIINFKLKLRKISKLSYFNGSETIGNKSS